MSWDTFTSWTGKGLAKPIFTLAGTEVTMFSVFTLILIVIITLFASMLLQRALNRTLAKRFEKEMGTLAAILRLVHYVILMIGLGIGMQTIGINMNALFAAGAVFAIAAGFAMQNIVQNFVSGIILLVERSIKPGDILEVDGTVIKVMDMRIRTTVGRTLLEEDIIIPNSILSQSNVKNLTYGNEEYWIGTTVGVTYDSDMKHVIEVLTKTAEQLPWRVKEKVPSIQMKEFGSSSVDFVIWVALPSPWRKRYHISEMNKAIWFAFKEEGITIAFPQVDVHFDSTINKSLDNIRNIAD